MPAFTETLASYVPNLIARRLATNPAPPTTPLSEPFLAAILFADISGFTALTERLAEQGPAGAEVLTRELNTYFGRLIDLITAHGGDVIKFAGDALLAVWPVTIDTDLKALSLATQQTAVCALAIQTALADYQTADGHKLAVRICIGAGNMSMVHVGGIYGRWEHLIVGSPLSQIGQAGRQTEVGQVVVSPEAWQLIKAHSTGEVLLEGFRRLLTVRAAAPPVTRLAPQLSADMEMGLRAYIPGAILTRLAAGQSGWLAELRRVTILFINLPDLIYTTPLEQGQMAMQAMQTALYRYEGSVNKISVDDKGTTLVAALGLPPLAHEDDAARGVQAALAIQTALQEELGWQYAIGITTGRVFCGSVGNTTRREYTMMGDVVNLAARLMQAAGQDSKSRPSLRNLGGAILCDETTYQAAQGQISFQSLSPIQVKGKSRPISIYHPLIILSESRIQNPKSKIEMVGRTTERMLLTDQLQKLQRDHSGVVIIEGEAGIGKSRLVADLLERARAMGVLSLLGAGDAIEKTTTYHAWQPIFRHIFGPIDPTDTTLAQAQLQARLAALDAGLVEQLPLLDAVLPFDFADNDTTRPWQGKVRAEQTRALLVRILVRTTTETNNHLPLLLIMEDAHWLDSASWALLQQVQQELKPLLLIVVTRPILNALGSEANVPAEYRHLQLNSEMQLLKLVALPTADTLSLICQRLGVTTLPPPVANFILEKTEGHPFFSEELAYALRDAELIKIEKGECHLMTDIHDLRLLNFPDTLQGVITSRIDRLTPSQQLALKVASVIGRIFAFQVLQEVHPIEADKPNLTDYLTTLERLDLTPLEASEPELSYIFKHVITQEVAYNLMAFAQRRQLHQAVAEWYERTYTGELAPFYPILAHHWRKATETQQADRALIAKAIDYLQKAGEQAVYRYATQEAIGFFNQALSLLEILPDTPERKQQELTLQIALGNVLMAAKGYAASEVEQTYSRARALCQQIGETSQMLPVLYGLWVFYLVRADHQTANQLAEEFLSMAQRQQDPARVVAYRTVGWVYCIGELVAARPHFEQIATLYKPEQHRPLAFLYGQDPGASGLASGALTFWLLGYPEQARRWSDEAIMIAREAAHPVTLAYSLGLVSFAHQFCREAAVVQACAEEDIALSTKLGFAMWLAWGSFMRGSALAAQGQITEGIAQMEHGLAAFRATGAELFRPYFLALLAEAHLWAGQIEEGLARLTEALTKVEQTGECYWAAEIYRLRGELLLSQHEENGKSGLNAVPEIKDDVGASSPEAYFLKAIDIARRQSAKSLELRAIVSLCRLWQQQDKKTEARQILTEIYHWFGEGFDTADLQEARALLETL